jgi:hypothetical protein
MFSPTGVSSSRDLHSSYLFLLCLEELSRFLLYKEEFGGIDLSVSHLLFVEDSLILMKSGYD